MGTMRGLFVVAIVVGAFGASRVGSGDPPDIQVVPASLLLGPDAPDGIVREELVVHNTGGAELTFGEVSVNHPEFTYGTRSGGILAGAVLAAGDSLEVVVSFRRSDPGVSFGALTFHSDDPDDPSLDVRLTGVAVPPPSIAVVPTVLSETLASRESVERDFTIVNTGSLALDWTLVSLPVAPGRAVVERAGGSPWLRADTTAGTATPGGSSLVRLTFDAATLAAGTYSRTLRVESNDPESPVVEVTATVVVGDTPDGGRELVSVSTSSSPKTPGR